MPPSPPDAADAKTMSANDVVRLLELAPHPEGGFYRETFRDTACLPGTSRALSTAIYFLLPEGVVARWHTVDAVETWHWHAGAPLALSVTAPDGSDFRGVILGPDLPGGQQPQGIVPTDHWQQARSLGAWTLVGCTVAPGFSFQGFRMAPDGWSPAATRTRSPP